jgi:hypothetical protein
VGGRRAGAPPYDLKRHREVGSHSSPDGGISEHGDFCPERVGKCWGRRAGAPPYDLKRHREEGLGSGMETP